MIKEVDCKTAFYDRETSADRTRCARLVGARARYARPSRVLRWQSRLQNGFEWESESFTIAYMIKGKGEEENGRPAEYELHRSGDRR